VRASAWAFGAALTIANCSGRRERVVQGTGGETVSGSGGGVTTSGPPAAPRGPHLVVPAVIDIPYVVAGQGTATAQVEITNDGDATLEGLSWMLSGDPTISLGSAPTSLGPGEKAELSLTWSGSSTEAIAQASLAVSMPNSAVDIPVFAVAGDPGLGSATWEYVEGAGGVIAGTGATVAMPAGPFPDGVSKYMDPSVRIFLPESYRDRAAQDMVLHFHGWNSTIASTLATHLYQEHVYASGSNAVLIVPQGPVDAPSGDFGKLMTKGGVTRLLTEVLILLYRERKITHPVRGDLVVTAHSGGYQAAAAALDPNNQPPKVAQVGLFDALYGYETGFEAFVVFAGGVLRSNYSESGGTLDTNQAMAAWFQQKGVKAVTEWSQRSLRDDAPVIDFAATTHVGTTRRQGAYGENLRWKLKHSRHGPRIELRELYPLDGTATVRWLAPVDEDVTGFVVETSIDGLSWTPAAKTTASASEATFPLATGARVRIKAQMKGMVTGDVLPSDTYRVDPSAKILVVDGFDRVLDGAHGGLAHDFAAQVGEAGGPVATISHRAVTEDGFDLSPWPVVLWLLGDQSTGDVSLSAGEQTALLDYVNGGGHLVMSGSELAFDTGQTAAGAMFLEQCFGAAFLADDSGSREVAGQGPLAPIATFAFGGPKAPYAAASPDALAPTAEGMVLLEYGSGMAASIGIAGKGALVAFPLELTNSGAVLGTLVKSLVAFAGG
jgi:hypothetical protein